MLDNQGTVLRGEESSVLIVEDDLAIGELLLAGLSHYGFNTRHLSDLNRAKSLLNEWKPDFILSDYHLANGTGDEILSLVLAKYPDLVAANRFQFITGEPEYVSSQDRAVEIKVHAKPFTIRSIVKSLLACPPLDSKEVVTKSTTVPLNLDGLEFSEAI